MKRLLSFFTAIFVYFFSGFIYSAFLLKKLFKNRDIFIEKSHIFIKKFDKCCRKWYISNTSRKNKNMRKIKRIDTNLTFCSFCAIIKVRKGL